MLILERTHFEATNPIVVARALRRWLARLDRLERDKEYGIVLILNVRNKVEHVDVISVGILNSTLLHPREVYRRAITLSASQIIYAHNHPSGDCSPSDEDIACTRHLADAGDVLGITLIDHIIFARNAFYSFRERGAL